MTHNVITLYFFYICYGAFVDGIHLSAFYTDNMVVVMLFFGITQAIMLFPVKQLDAGKDAAPDHAFQVSIYTGKTALPELIPEPGPGIFRCHMAVIINEQLYYGFSQRG